MPTWLIGDGATASLGFRLLAFFVVWPHPPCLLPDDLGHRTVFGLELVQQFAEEIVPDLSLDGGYDVVLALTLGYFIDERCGDVLHDVVVVRRS
jgi:hypothetical protein